MLQNINISNYALIDRLNVDLAKGLTIITGETGAGKSILLGALSLILGSRADVDALKDKTQKCIIEGTFDISNYDLTTFFKENDLDYASETILRREISSSGRSRAFINDTPVTLQVMKDLGECLVDVHSQHETLLLRDKNFIISLLDYYSNNIKLLLQYKGTFFQFKEVEKKQQIALSEQSRQTSDLDYHQFLFDELEKANIQAEEQEALENELEILSHSEEIKSVLSESTSALGLSDSSILSTLNQINLRLEKVADYYPTVKALFERLKSSEIELQDVQSELENLDSDIEYEPNRLEYLQERINLLNGLQKKHNAQNNAELLAIKNELEEKISKTLHFDEDIEQLNKELTRLKLQLESAAQQLSEKRKEAALKLEVRLVELLASVGIGDAQIKFSISEAQELMASGKDSVELQFSANKGSALQPIQKIASGGELSRLMLCLKAVKSAHQKLPTIIFDEIDTGVSGNIAHKMGEIIKVMAKEMQVIAITHLPQIAAKADSHFVVYKENANDSTYSRMKLLNKEERVEEVAKMLSSENISETALKNAEHLING